MKVISFIVNVHGRAQSCPKDHYLCWQPYMDNMWPNWQQTYLTVAQAINQLRSSKASRRRETSTLLSFKNTYLRVWILKNWVGSTRLTTLQIREKKINAFQISLG